jgi:multiple sugar transport system permease protein
VSLASTARTPRASDKTRDEQRLAWKLAGPAFVVMLAVTLYPILNALWLSLFSYRLTDPDNRSFVGLPTTGSSSPTPCGGRRSASRR